MNALGIIFSDMQDWNMTELASHRSVAAIPYGGRYRLIDFTLSNMVNSGLNKMCIITKSNYRSLMEHVGSGKDWDLSRKKGGILIFPPYALGENHGLFQGRLDALKRVLHYISSSKEKYVILSDCDMIYNIDYNDVIRYHIEKDSEITAVYTKTNIERDTSVHKTLYEIDDDGRANDILVNPITEGNYNVSLNTWVMNKDFLEKLIYDAIAHNYKDFSYDVLASRVSAFKIYCYEYTGYYAHIDSLKSYYNHSMELLHRDKLNSLFYAKTGPIYTKTKDSPPTKYGKDAEAKTSLIASGCIIEGYVENSIIFRGVKVGKNSVIKNSILMQHTTVGENTQLDSIITDTYAMINDDRVLLGYSNCPFFIKRYSIV
ncbi:glucose-1-phosphate adenylyltransferase [Sedimentibacter acidaminivorans]|jgi:glucose-1-phosphate adenylyltransferase|uniref:Glucose-1-phosphate adenylyltransferase n=1 Tax=Sedimentibacter acidaminivorans TaxID=913099 RepID=A0ABS4GFH9_9FIRM|nr:glucose-1-phosphate adenylyltransferase subunit GlgD [Sedimentibacter acidaminivorans]MBP1926453.1 glucose-1-phosphate adenylyltransferase [Sedimentibacter acidaminivorans]